MITCEVTGLQGGLEIPRFVRFTAEGKKEVKKLQELLERQQH